MKTIYHILFSLLFVLAFVGCDDDDDKVIERNQLKLTASAQSATLTPDATDDKIISFSWNEATSLGADYTFSYLFQIDMQTTTFSRQPMSAHSDPMNRSATPRPNCTTLL